MEPQVDVEAFERDGYVLVRGVFSRDEVAELRRRVIAARTRAFAAQAVEKDRLGHANLFIKGDLLGQPELAAVDYVAFDERVVAAVRRILGDELVYWGDSSVQTGEGQRGFHKDNVDRADARGLDWVGRYPIVRVGVYLQDHASHSGGLKVRRRSHNYVSHHRGRAVNLDLRVGDVAIWSLRTSHSGNVVRARFLPVCLHPRLETLVPRALRVPEQAERIACFCSFGKPSQNLDRYVAYQRARPDMLDYFRRAGVDEAATKVLAARRITLVRPIAEYGVDAAKSTAAATA